MRTLFTKDSTKPGLGRLALYGAFGAIYGSGAMTLVRLATRRGGLVDKMVPEAVVEWAARKLGTERLGEAGHFTAHQLLHLAYGTAWGGLAAPALFARRRRQPLGVGAIFGLGTWALAAFAMFPLLRIARPAWKSSTAENTTNIAAHLLFGLAVQLLTEETVREGQRGATSDVTRRLARVG